MIADDVPVSLARRAASSLMTTENLRDNWKARAPAKRTHCDLTEVVAPSPVDFPDFTRAR